jgi:hypothetical protein
MLVHVLNDFAVEQAKGERTHDEITVCHGCPQNEERAASENLESESRSRGNDCTRQRFIRHTTIGVTMLAGTSRSAWRIDVALTCAVAESKMALKAWVR